MRDFLLYFSFLLFIFFFVKQIQNNMDTLFDLTFPTVFILIIAVLVVGFWGEIRSEISSFLTRKPKNMDLNPLADVIGFFFLLAVFSLIWACVAARTAACSGWFNPSVPIGLILSIVIVYIIFKSFSKILWNYKIVTLVISLCFAVLLTAFSSFISPALHNFTEVDEYHHPVFVPVNNEWINALIVQLGKIFPMSDNYPVIHLERRIYSPESSFIFTFTMVFQALCSIVGIIMAIFLCVEYEMKKTSESCKKCSGWFNRYFFYFFLL